MTTLRSGVDGSEADFEQETLALRAMNDMILKLGTKGKQVDLSRELSSRLEEIRLTIDGLRNRMPITPLDLGLYPELSSAINAYNSTIPDISPILTGEGQKHVTAAALTTA